MGKRRARPTSTPTSETAAPAGPEPSATRTVRGREHVALRAILAVGSTLVAVTRTTLRWSAPRVVAAAAASGRALRAATRLASRHRASVLAVGVRLAFWGALLLWATTAIDVLGGETLDVEVALRHFGLGALVCAFAVVLAVARHVRWASWAVGSLHGASATVLYLLAHA